MLRVSRNSLVRFHAGILVAMSVFSFLFACDKKKKTKKEEVSKQLSRSGPWIQTTKIVVQNGYEIDEFGSAVSISGNTILVGARFAKTADGDPFPDRAGAVYFYQRHNQGWKQAIRFSSPDSRSDTHFGQSVAIDGTWAIAGAPFEKSRTPENDLGAVYVLRKSGEKWVRAQRLDPSNRFVIRSYGFSVAINGDSAFVGAPGSQSENKCGTGYFFQVAKNRWKMVQELAPLDCQDEQGFGRSVILSKKVIVIGAEGDDRKTGAVYVFRQHGDKWKQSQKLTAADGREGDLFGCSLAIDDKTIAIGAIKNDDAKAGKKDTGAVYIFKEVAGKWRQTQKLVADDAQSEDLFGNALAMSGDRLLVGASYDDASKGIYEAGAAYVFHLRNGRWVQEQKLTAADPQPKDRFGFSLDMDGKTAVIGAMLEDGDSDDLEKDFGSAYIFERVGR